MLDLYKIRADFPHLGRCTYLNTAAVGLSWEGQGRAVAKFYDSAKALGMQGSVEWAAAVEAARRGLGALMGVPPECIQFVGSTTEALNLVVLSLPLRRGDKVVMAQDEFPSIVQAWLGWPTKGVEVIQVPIAHEAQRTEALCAAVQPGVCALTVSHVHWRTGTRVDIAQLSARCREFDCRLIVDGVQAVGAVPVRAGFADAYCASVFKWLLSGFGLGFVAVSATLANELQPVFRGYSNERPSHSLRYGHINYPGVYALLASLEYLQAFGWDEIFSRVNDLALHATASLNNRGFEVVTPIAAHGGIVSIKHPQASRVVQALAAEGIFVEDRGGVVRAAPHFYNTEEDIDHFVSALVRHS